MKLLVLILALAAGSAYASCPNSCSGHGVCGAFDLCECYANWQGNDCSARTCAYGWAWVDTASGNDNAHNYAECSNKGVCDRKTGQCKCYDGYEGKACRRSSCPNDCSGHGTCEFIEELAESIVSGGQLGRHYGPMGHHDNMDDAQWDAWKIQGCQCDGGWEGTDCSSRMCPRGDDPLTTDQNNYQEIFMHDGTGGTYTLTYWDNYNFRWTTRPLTFDSSDDEVKAALLDMPNRAVEEVTVTSVSSDESFDRTASCTVTSAGGVNPDRTCNGKLMYPENHSGHGPGADCTAATCKRVEWIAPPNNDHLLEVNTDGCTADGCYPWYSGLTGGAEQSRHYGSGAGATHATWLTGPDITNADCVFSAHAVETTGSLGCRWTRTESGTNYFQCTHNTNYADGFGQSSTHNVVNDVYTYVHNPTTDSDGPWTHEATWTGTGKKHTDTNFMEVAVADTAAVSIVQFGQNGATEIAQITCDLSSSSAVLGDEWWTTFGATSKVWESTVAHTSQGTGGWPLAGVGNNGVREHTTCSNRGDCDGSTGLCTCYEGFSDDDCSVQTILV